MAGSAADAPANGEPEPEADSVIPVVAAVVQRDGRYLVALRPGHKRHGGHWEFPGGKVASGETEADALGRELAEELGIRVRSVGPSLFRGRDGTSPFSVRFRRVEIAGEPEAREHDAVRWADPASLLRLRLAPVDARFAQEILARD